MNKMGRPPTPTSLKLLRGNPGKRKLNTNEPDPPSVIPSCPNHLNHIAKAEWRRITKELLALGLISKLDRAAVAAYCDAYANWVEACEQLEKFGKIMKAPSGYPIVSPYVAIRAGALVEMRAFLTEFGMTPGSRSRVKVANPKQRNLFEDFLNGEDGTV